MDKNQTLQFELLKKQIQRVFHKSKFYRDKFSRTMVTPDDIKSIEDIHKLPFTTREELQNNFDHILSVSSDEIKMFIQTSGTTSGSPLTLAHTKNDINMIAESKKRELSLYGVTRQDVAQVTLPYGLWQGAWSTHWGLEEIGSCIIAIGPGDTERQLNLMRKFGTTVLFATPNYHLRIAEILKKTQVNKNDLSLRVGVSVAGKLSNQQIDMLKQEMGYESVYIDYGATEFPGFCTQCPANAESHHIWSDNYFVEIVDPETHQPLPEGTRGELVITSLRKEATPLIRYLSRDISTLYHSNVECECGLTHPKIDADICREDFMVKIRGATLFPGQIERLVEEIFGVTSNVQIVVDRRQPSEILTLNIEANNCLSEATTEDIKGKILRYTKTFTGISVNKINFVPVGTFGNKYQKSVVIK
ncbi:MAG: AMP-binding protein [Candidatus Brocadiaceae bacterium]